MKHELLQDHIILQIGQYKTFLIELLITTYE